MRSAHQIDVLFLQEVGYYVTTEDKTDSSLILCPAGHALFGIGPEEVAEQSLVRYFEGSD